MGVMDFFKGGNDNSNTNNQPTTQPTTPTASPQGDGKMAGTNQEPVNPLDAYSKLFDNANKNQGDAPPSFALDPKILSEVSGSMDFMRDVPPDLMQKATTGDVNALMQVMNQVARGAYQASLHHSSTLTDKFVGARSKFDLQNIGSNVRKELTTSELANTPNYNHPVVKKQLNDIAEQLRASNPDASPKEIAETAQKYLMDLANAINPNSTTSKQDESDGEFDWSQYLTKK